MASLESFMPGAELGVEVLTEFGQRAFVDVVRIRVESLEVSLKDF